MTIKQSKFYEASFYETFINGLRLERQDTTQSSLDQRNTI